MQTKQVSVLVWGLLVSKHNHTYAYIVHLFLCVLIHNNGVYLERERDFS